MTSACCKLTLAAVFLVLAVGGAIVAVLLPPQVHDKLVSGVVSYVTIDSQSAEGWKAFVHSSTLDQEVYYDLFAYDLRNLDEFMNGAQPIFKELGPFTFRLREEKIDAKVSADGKNVSYKLWRYMIPMKPDDANVTITIPNLGLWAIAGNIHANTTASKDSLWDMVNLLFGFKLTPKEIAFQQRTVADLFFGYEDPLLEKFASVAHIFKIEMPTRFPGLQPNTSSPELARNRTGVSVQLTGKDDMSQARQFVQWNGMKSLRCCQTGPCGGQGEDPATGKPAWPADFANDLTTGAGTDGTQFSTLLPEEGSVQKVFVDALVRATELSSIGNGKHVIKGIPCQRFSIPKSEMQNSTYTPANAAYGMSGIPTGLMNLEACEGGVPILVSKPHFLDADPSLATAVAMEGTSPVSGRENLDTFLDVEPTTGTTMQVAERLQINMKFGPFGSHIPDVRKLVYPLGWLNKRGVVSDASVTQWHEGVGFARIVSLGVTAGGAALGGLAITAAAVCGALGLRQCYSGKPDDERPGATIGGLGGGFDDDIYEPLEGARAGGRAGGGRSVNF